MNRVEGQPLFVQDPNCHCIDPRKDFVLNPAAWSVQRNSRRQQHQDHSRKPGWIAVDWHGLGLRRIEGGVQGNPFLTPQIIDGTNISMLYESPWARCGLPPTAAG